MKEKILARFKAKFPAVNLSKKRLDALADKLEPKITDESQIDAQLDALNDAFSFEDIARNDDQIRDLSGKLKKAANPEKKEEPSSEIPADAPEWMKTFMKQQQDSTKAMADKLSAFEAKERNESIRGSISKALTGKDGKEVVPSSYWQKRALPEKAEDVEGFVKELTDDFTAFKQEMTNQGLSSMSRPLVAAQNAQQTAVSPAVKQFMDKQNQATAPKVS